MRLLRLILGDIRFQFKYGFYFTYAVFCVLYIFVLFLIPELWREKAASIMIYSDPAAMGLFFMGAIVLLEKSQRVLNALAVSPIKVHEYIMAKVISFVLISVTISFLIALAAEFDNIGTVLLSTALTSVIFTLMGLIIAAKISSLNQYIIRTVPLEIICVIVPVLYLFVSFSAMRWFPLNGSIALIAGSSKNVLIDVALLVVTIMCLALIAYKTTVKMWRSVGGVRL